MTNSTWAQPSLKASTPTTSGCAIKYRQTAERKTKGVETEGVLQGGALWRQPHQPHPGTQCSRCGCCLPALTRFTGNRCGGTDGVTITTLASRQAAPLYRSHRKLQPLVRD